MNDAAPSPSAEAISALRTKSVKFSALCHMAGVDEFIRWFVEMRDPAAPLAFAEIASEIEASYGMAVDQATLWHWAEDLGIFRGRKEGRRRARAT